MSLLTRLGGGPRMNLRESVLANLRRLLAAHPGMAAAQPWLGVPVDPGLGQAGLDRLRAAVAEAVRRGEPRLDHVEVEAEGGGDGLARLTIRGAIGDLQLDLAADAAGAVLRPCQEDR